MRALESGKTETERCEICDGAGWLLSETPAWAHFDRTRVGPDAIARARPCKFTDHDDDCIVIPSRDTYTVAKPCPECKPNWVHPDDRTPPEEPETKEKKRTRESQVVNDSGKRWWD